MSVPFHLLSNNLIQTWHITQDTPYSVDEIDARTLLTPQRIDLAAKLAYIEAKESGADISFARELYTKHIEAFSQGYFTEPGDDKKNSLDQFFSSFDRLIDDIKNNGFDAEKSLVPVGERNIILDGAHRTACAIYFGKQIRVIRFPDFKVNFGYEYFRERHLSGELLQYMARVYGKYTVQPIYCACLWPVSSTEKRGKAVDVIAEQHPIVFRTEVSLSQNGLRNFMLQIYQHQNWIGTVENHFTGVMGKVNACFAPGVTTEVILFENGTLNEVLSMKDQIRDIFKLDKHAIHISDSNRETNLMISLLLNENSLHALNHGKPDEFPDFWNMLLRTGENAVYSADCTLAYYGIRDVKQLNCQIPCYDTNDPRSYFIFMDRMIPALHIVKDLLEHKSADYHAVCSILRESNPHSVAKRQMDYWRTSFIWNSKKIILRFKQILARAATSVGLYEKLHALHNIIREHFK